MKEATITYEAMRERAQTDESFRDGLIAAAIVARAQNTGLIPCPSAVAAVYIDRLASGELP